MTFSQQFIEEITKKMQQEKEAIEKELAKFTVETKAGTETVFPQYGDNITDNAEEVASYDNDLSVKNTLEKSLRDINEALARITKGNYGICKYCKKMIPEKRLRVRPTSSACIACKTKLAG